MLRSDRRYASRSMRRTLGVRRHPSRRALCALLRMRSGGQAPRQARWIWRVCSRSTIMGLREQRHGRLQACDISIRRGAARRPRRRRQGVRRRQAHQARRLRDRAGHPGGLADRARPAREGGRQARQGGEPAAAPHQAAGAGAAAFGDLLRGRELRRPRRRDECPPRQAAGPGSAHARPAILALPQGHALDLQSGRDREGFRLFEADGLGGGTRRRHRPSGQERVDGQGLELRRRLYRRQRSFRARPRPAPAYRRYLAVQGRLGRAQELRRLLPARSLDRAG